MADNAHPRLSSPTSSTDTITVPTDGDIESQRRLPEKLSHWRKLWDAGAITQDVLNYKYSGFGSAESPYLVEWLPSDPRNPMEFSDATKYFITCAHAGATLAVSFASSAYSGGVREIINEFHVSQEVSILGVSLFVLGFAVGPLISAPLSEMFGRQKVFFFSYMSLAAFNAGSAAAPNMAGLVVLRFLGGALGSAPLTNAGGVIADMFPAAKRGIATSIFAMAPFLGPSLGPIAGGFLGEAAGWRWVLGLTAVFSGAFWILNTFTYPETYSPVLLRKRAATLSQLTGKVYISKMEANQPVKTIGSQLSVSLSRPWALLFTEPIVLLLSIYMAIIYGTLYMCFAAFPIVFEAGRGWSPGISGLSFVGIAVGMSLSTAATIFDNKRYERIVAASPTGAAPPEARLPPTMLGSLLIPIGLFWFAWTNGPSVHWVVPIIGSAIFASGIVLVFLSALNYLIDSYVIYAASALAANSVLRSLFGAAFPLFTTYMYNKLGIHWASSIPAFLALVCVPFPFLFYKFGARIRAQCRYASEAAAFVEKMRADANARMTTAQAMIETETEMETELEGEARAPKHK